MILWGGEEKKLGGVFSNTIYYQAEEGLSSHCPALQHAVCGEGEKGFENRGAGGWK